MSAKRRKLAGSLKRCSMRQSSSKANLPANWWKNSRVTASAVSRYLHQPLKSFAEKENPQGLAAVVRQKRRSLDSLPVASFPFLTALVAPQDPGNVGSILRTLDAVGANGLILLDGGADPYQTAAVRASMGTLFWQPFVQTSFSEFAAWKKQNRHRLIGTSAHGNLDYHAIKLDQRPTILLLGNEQKGLSPEQIAACDDLVALPMRGRASSLNLAVAAGILLYALKG